MSLKDDLVLRKYYLDNYADCEVTYKNLKFVFDSIGFKQYQAKIALILLLDEIKESLKEIITKPLKWLRNKGYRND